MAKQARKWFPVDTGTIIIIIIGLLAKLSLQGAQ